MLLERLVEKTDIVIMYDAYRLWRMIVYSWLQLVKFTSDDKVHIITDCGAAMVTITRSYCHQLCIVLQFDPTFYFLTVVSMIES